ncbi:hypothetical protein MD273_17485 [Marinobacter pelagius]|uniref:hypothetical protein n=1 Tax=Marinobacter sp. C7 TaxID=2951363 RepID=UPI001EF156F7|nr:hypothetical protein [Marinobacter sp. C7]MCG7201534.1 hypothetical protein [Marinobacter sp. C7]
MKMNSRVLTGVAFAATGVLAGCGGGGGDGGGSATATLQLDPSGYGDQTASIRTLSDLDAAAVMYDDVAAIESFMSDVEFALGTTGMTAMAVAADQYCSEANGNLTITEEFTATRDYSEYQFDNCVVPNYGEYLLLDGTMSAEARYTDGGNGITLTESYDISGKLGVDEIPVGIVGRQSISVSGTSESDLNATITTPALEYLYGNQYVALRNSQINMVIKGDVLTLTMNSQLVGSAIDGYLSITTPTKITANMYETCPSSGHMRVAGDGKIDVRYGASTLQPGPAMEVILNDSTVEYYETCDAAGTPFLDAGLTGALSDPAVTADKTVALPTQ